MCRPRVRKGWLAVADRLEASLTLPSEPVSVPAARKHVSRVLTEWGIVADAGLVDALRLIVSELATNAVQHTSGQSPSFTVELRLEREELLLLGVTDSHPRRPRRMSAGVQQDSGRGMAIVRVLAEERGGRVGVTPTADGGKTVWIELPWAGSVRS